MSFTKVLAMHPTYLRLILVSLIAEARVNARKVF
jgi:hypothetical protein